MSGSGLEITLADEVHMPKKPPSHPTPKSTTKSPTSTSTSRVDAQRAKLIDDLVRQVSEEVKGRLGPNPTFEQESDAAFEIMREVLRRRESERLKESVTDADEVEIDGKTYRKMRQASSATYVGRFGSHRVEEPLYREVGVRNGPTIKPVERRVGIVDGMLPDFARVCGELSADQSSRELFRTLRAVGHVPPSRAFLADHMTSLSDGVAGIAGELNTAARARCSPPVGVASVSCGLDRMSVRMSEVVDGAPCTRDEPYERSAPPQMEHHYRKAWVGSVTTYDATGEALSTWRTAVEATANPDELADRVAAEVAWVLDDNPGVPVHCIQDAAPELEVLPSLLHTTVPSSGALVELVDFEHLAGYLDAVVAAVDPADKNDMRRWYRATLLIDDDGVDRIQRSLRRQAANLPREATEARKAVAAALSYIRPRKAKMRYASYYRENLPIGSGATESTCWQMQQRVKLPGQSWKCEGLRGVLAVRSLVLSDRWPAAWDHYAARFRGEVAICA